MKMDQTYWLEDSKRLGSWKLDIHDLKEKYLKQNDI